MTPCPPYVRICPLLTKPSPPSGADVLYGRLGVENSEL